MQIVETANEGLKRAFSVTIPASDIAGRIDGEVRKIAPQVRMPGFRPGKVPANLVRKMHGPALHQEALNTAIREGLDKLVRENKLRPAMQPKVELGEGYEEGQDVKLDVTLEVLPDLEAPSLDDLKLEKLTVPVSDDAVDEAVAKIAAGQKRFADAKKGAKAKDGDQLVIDFAGSIDGVPFEGGTAEDQPIEIGAGRFIPGFEEQLVGAKAGDELTIEVTFPEDYGAPHLAGKAAQFAVTVKAVKNPGEMTVDDDFAKSLGLEGLEQLRGLMRGQLEQETAGLTRTQMKRALLDQLAAGADFAVPPSMVDAEFEQIWAQIEQEAAGEADPEAARAEIEAEKDDYRNIAERRVRLGLLLSEIGQANNVQVTAQEMEMLIARAAQQYRQEDRQRFIDYVRSEPLAAAQIRAPLYEDKVVDFLFDKAEVTEREVTREELQAAIEADETGASPAAEGADEKPAKKAAKKPAKPKKGAVEPEDAAENGGDHAVEAEPVKGAVETDESAAAPAKPSRARKAAANADETPESGDDKSAEKPAKKTAAKKPAAKKAAKG